MTRPEPEPSPGFAPRSPRQVKLASQPLTSDVREAGSFRGGTVGSHFSRKVWAKPTALSQTRLFGPSGPGYLAVPCSWSRVPGPAVHPACLALPVIVWAVSGKWAAPGSMSQA